MFLHTESSSNFADIKKKIAANFSMDVAHIMLLGNDKVRQILGFFIRERMSCLFLISWAICFDVQRLHDD
jgi:hypothetical protein